jgi:hypothetical protein
MAMPALKSSTAAAVKMIPVRCARKTVDTGSGSYTGPKAESGPDAAGPIAGAGRPVGWGRGGIM